MRAFCITLLVATVATFPLTARAQAQDSLFQRPRVMREPAPERVVYVTYDVQADRIRSIREGSADDLALGNPPCYDNSVPTLGPGVWAWAAPNIGEELVAWGSKNCRESGLIRRITFGYGSYATDPRHGGPGATLSVALYRGTHGFGVLGSETFRATLSGLPSEGQVYLTLDFGTRPLLVPDGNIGWSALELDGTTGLQLVRAPDAFLGTADALDLYAPGPAPLGNYVGTFNYGGCSGNPNALCASLYLQLDEIPKNEVAGSVVRNGTGVNPVLLSESRPAQLGGTWVASIDLRGQPFPTTTLLFLSAAPFGPVLKPYGEILIDPGQLILDPLPASDVYFMPVPLDLTLAGLRIYAQGAVLPPGGLFATNSLRVTIGY